ncbi:PDZ domain-containing protein [Prauserella marina]|uniref:endopeptidase La n=1 Tax=Prauserella marina TaxID=530584 RepID=A0A1G6ZD24_9PSEU|nr:PDZ domain-containing protein [Prauserella marina]SDE00544.1 PDZ domain-containing protein [Prauserella marina]
MCSSVLIVAFVLVGALVRVPYVALGPGPTYDTLGAVNGEDVVSIDGQRTYQTDGELRMTTVSLNDNVTLFGAIGLWVSGRYAVAPREEYFRPGETDEQVRKENVKQFQDSQSNAEVAALRRLGYPVKVIVQEVVSGSPADRVLEPGDQLVVVNGERITNEDDVRSALAGTRPGETVSLTFEHEGQPQRTETITLGKHPDEGQEQGFVGMQPIDRADVPFDVNISLEDVGGPSAGLMFALAIIDRLTPEDLVAGEHVAGTGEITEKGEVGAIGGISFKVVAAREAGATVFLVPRANCAEAASAAPEGLKLIKVSNLDGAVTALEDLRQGRPTPSC